MLWLDRTRIPAGNWSFLSTTRAGLAKIESELEPDIDLTEDQGAITITGCMRAYRQAVMRRAIDLSHATVANWNGGQLIGAIVCSRALLETIATYHSFLIRAEAYADKKQWHEIGELVDTYSFSASQNNKQPKGEFSPPRISRLVKDFISRTEKSKEHFWDQISDTSHPNGNAMMRYAGVLKEGHFLQRHLVENDGHYFPAIYNSLYSCCWLIASDLEFNILLEVIREGDRLPHDHPLILQKTLIDSVTKELNEESRS